MSGCSTLAGETYLRRNAFGDFDTSANLLTGRVVRSRLLHIRGNLPKKGPSRSEESEGLLVKSPGSPHLKLLHMESSRFYEANCFHSLDLTRWICTSETQVPIEKHFGFFLLSKKSWLKTTCRYHSTKGLRTSDLSTTKCSFG